MPMHPLDRKAELVRRNVRLAAIARSLELSLSQVSNVLYGHRRHVKVEREIARIIGRDVTEVFPPIETLQPAVPVGVSGDEGQAA